MNVSVSETSRCSELMVTRPVLVCSQTALARSRSAPRSRFGFCVPSATSGTEPTSHSSRPFFSTQCANASEAW